MPLSPHQRRRALRTSADWPEDQLPYPLNELTDAEISAPDSSFQNLPNPTTPNRPDQIGTPTNPAPMTPPTFPPFRCPTSCSINSCATGP